MWPARTLRYDIIGPKLSQLIHLSAPNKLYISFPRAQHSPYSLALERSYNLVARFGYVKGRFKAVAIMAFRWYVQRRGGVEGLEIDGRETDLLYRYQSKLRTAPLLTQSITTAVRNPESNFALVSTVTSLRRLLNADEATSTNAREEQNADGICEGP
jgi:hypothetical protein